MSASRSPIALKGPRRAHFWQRARGLALCGTVGALASLAADPAPERPLLELAQNAHRAAIESLQSVECDVTVMRSQHGEASHKIAQGHYSRSGAAVRVQEETARGTQDGVVKDSAATVLGKERVRSGERPVPGSAVRTSIPEVAFSCDVWSQMLMQFHAPGQSRCRSLDEVLANALAPPDVTKVHEGENEYVQVDVIIARNAGTDAHMQLLLDPRVNYLVKREILGPYSRTRGVFEVKEFSEPVPGVFMPVAAITQTITDGREDSRLETKLSNVRINQPVPPDRFDLKMPAGTLVLDRIRHKQYKVGADGRPSGPEQDLVQAVALPVAKVDERESARSQTAGESGSLLRQLVLPISLILLIGGAIWIIRARKAAET
jgi:hypothetical protein